MQNGGPYDIGGLTEERISAGLVDPTPPPPAPSMIPVSMHVPSTTPVIQNRRRMEPTRVMESPSTPTADVPTSDDGVVSAPSLTALPAHLVANAHRQTSQEMDALHKKLASLYSPEQFEPTPINPNHQLSMRENARVDSPSSNYKSNNTTVSPHQTRHERSDSLEFDKIFQPDGKSPKPSTKSSGGNIDDLSNQLSNMSFSVGDIAAIQDEGNLSSLFDESTRLKERSSSSAESNNNKGSGTKQQQQMPLNMSSLGPTDMSMSTLGGDSLANLQSMNMSTTSFTHVFEESTDKF